MLSGVGANVIGLSVSLPQSVACGSWAPYCVSSSRRSRLPPVCASCSGVTPSSFGRVTAINPPGWQSNSSASLQRPQRTARWRGDSLGLCSGNEGRQMITKRISERRNKNLIVITTFYSSIHYPSHVSFRGSWGGGSYDHLLMIINPNVNDWFLLLRSPGSLCSTDPLLEIVSKSFSIKWRQLLISESRCRRSPTGSVSR